MTDRAPDAPRGCCEEAGGSGARDGGGNGRAGSGERRRRGRDRWEEGHEAEGEAANRAGEGAHRVPDRLSPQRPELSPDRPSSHSLPRSRPHHPQTHATTSTALPPSPRPSSPPSSPPRPTQMLPSALLPLLHCPLCAPPALLRAPVTLHCGHTFCASHLVAPNRPSTSRAADSPAVLPPCPLPTCSSPSARASPPFSHAPPLDVTVNKLIDILASPPTPTQDTAPPPTFHDDPDDHTDSEYEVDSDSDLEYLPLPPQSPTSPASQHPRPLPREPDSTARASPSSPTHASPRRHSRSRSHSSPRLPPRKRRRPLHRRVSPAQAHPSPHRTDHDPQARLEKELFSELTCEICFGLLWQPLTTPCQHTFCTRCLFRSLDHSQSCPLCRQKLPGYDYFQQHPCNRVVLAIILKAFPEAYAERGATIEAEERDARLDTPVFVCQLSFPGMPTMLHFFEPRYRLMLRRCLDSPHPCFGMIPPPRASPVATAGGSNTGNDYGTMLAIRNVQMLPDGRSLVETWGTWRFRIMERGTLDGYMVARIERIEDYEEELDEAAVAPEEPNADAGREDLGQVGPSDDSARQIPPGGRAVGTSSATSLVQEQHEAAVRAELGDAATPAQTASTLAPRPDAGAIHASSSTSSAAEHASGSQGRTARTSQEEPVTSKEKDSAESSTLPPSPQSPSPRPPTNAELMAKCHAFIDQMREGTPWVVQHLNNNYVPMPSDPASFSFWMALLLPIDEHEKAKLLPIRSPRLRLRLVVHWIEQLNSNWARAYASASAWQVVLWRVRRLLARRALGFWAWLAVYAVLLAAVYHAQTDWRRGQLAADGEGGTVARVTGGVSNG